MTAATARDRLERARAVYVARAERAEADGDEPLGAVYRSFAATVTQQLEQLPAHRVKDVLWTRSSS